MFDQSLYDRMIAAGESRTIAEICASRKVPSNHGTDRSFMEGRLLNHGLGDNRFEQEMIVEAKEAGIDITGKVYCGPIADSRGHLDPEAWVSGVDDVKRVCRERNLQARGSVHHNAVEMPPERDVPLADDIIDDEIQQLVAADPKNSERDRREMREEVIAAHTPNWSTTDA